MLILFQIKIRRKKGREREKKTKKKKNMALSGDWFYLINTRDTVKVIKWGEQASNWNISKCKQNEALMQDHLPVLNTFLETSL